MNAITLKSRETKIYSRLQLKNYSILAIHKYKVQTSNIVDPYKGSENNQSLFNIVKSTLQT